MMEFQFEEEIHYARYYADKLANEAAKRILEARQVSSAEEATALSQFFWAMVKASIEDEKNNIELEWDDGAEFWNEKLLQSFSGYLERIGYEKQWDDVLNAL